MSELTDMTTTPNLPQLSPLSSPTVQTFVDLTDLFQRVLDQVDITEGTRKTYRYGVKDFVSWNVEGRLDRPTLTRYKNYLRERTDLSTGTKNLYLSGVRTVVRSLFVNGVTPTDPSKDIKGFKVTRSHKSGPITDDEVSRVFKLVKKMTDKRLLVIYTLLYYQGLRQKECLTIRVEDLNLSIRSLSIVGKGRDDRELIDLHPETVRILEWYLKETELKSGYLLWSRKQKSGHMTSRHLSHLIKTVHEQCGLETKGHSWRKVFVSKLIDSGMDLLTVSQFSRHKSIEMLKIYYDRIDHKKKLPKYYEVFGSQT
jgi:site-specific recombinase XerD